MVRMAPVSRWPSGCGPGTPARTRQVSTPRPRGWPRRLPRQLLTRADSGGGTHDFLKWLAKPGRLAYSVEFTITGDIQDAILAIPAEAWTPAYDADRQVRPGAWAAGLTGLPGLSAWPKGMRVIVRKERPHPGAQLRFTCFATSTKGGQLADLELRHRRRARCEDRILLGGSAGLSRDVA